MAKFYIQTDKGLIQVGNDITLENIKAALGYTPSNFSGDFYDLTNNPFSNGADGEFNIVDENQNIIAIVDKDGIHSVEMTAIKSGITHNLTEKMDASEFESIITVDESGKFVIEDENGNEGLKLDSTGLYVKDVTAGKHVLSQKADLDDIDFNNLVDNPIYIDDTGEFVIEDESGNKGFILNKSGVEAKNFTTSDGASLNDIGDRVNSIQDKVDSINEMISDDEDDRFIIRDGDGEVGLELNKDGLYVKDVTTYDNEGNPKDVLSQKADLDIVNKKLDKSEFTETIGVVEGRVDTNENNITNLSNTVNSHKSQINSIQGEVDSINEMISDAEESSFIVSDSNDYIGLKLDQEGLHVKDVIAYIDKDSDNVLHKLSEKANQSDVDVISVITSASASVDSNVGIPSATVSLIGDDVKNKTLNFEFKNLKGVKGEIGYGIFYTNTEYNSDTTSIIKSDIIDNVRTIQVGDLVLSSNGNIFSVKEIEDNLNVEYLTSIKGTSVTISDVDEKTGSGEISTVTFSNGDSLSIKNGEDGIGIKDITKKDSSDSNSDLVDTYTITYTDDEKEPYDFYVTNGKDGDKGDDGYSIFYTSHPYSEQTAGIIYTYIDTYGRTIQVGDLILSSNGNIFSVKKVGELLLDVVTVEYLTSIKGVQGASVSSIVCVDGDNSENLADVNNEDGAINYYRIKDNNNNFLEGTIAIKNGSSDSGDSDSDVDIDITFEEDESGEFVIIDDSADENIGLILDSEGVAAKDFFTSSDVSLNDVGDRLSVVEDSIGIELITYDNLVQLRNDKLLIPGKKYRITDYVTTTLEASTTSAGHQFDIIVTALTENELSEIASACYHEENYNEDNLEELYIGEFNSITGWDGGGCTFSYSGIRYIDGKVYLEYVDKNNSGNKLYFDFNDKSKVYFDSSDVIKFIPSYYIAPEYGYNDLTENNVSLLGDGDFYVPYISTYDNMVDGNETPISISIREEFNRNYFKNLGCNLSAWKIWYSLDNNSDRFAWANSKGKGVIYRMIDEWGNDCPYDFKNIQFAKTIDDETITSYTFSWRKEYTLDFSTPTTPMFSKGIYIKDTSIAGNNGLLLDDKGNIPGVYNNVIKPNIYTYYGNKQYLNRICFCSSFNYDGYYHMCINNSFGNNCSSNTFGNDCSYNTFGNECFSNTFGNECNSNTFGNGCNSNTFGNGCYYNTFCNKVFQNTFGNSCSSNIFGNACYDNTFGNECFYNTFGNDCNSNTFGNSCYDNTFGNACYSNTFGNYCFQNTFGNRCNNIIFGNSESTPSSYYRYIIIDSGNHHINLNCTSTTTISNYYQNVRIELGVNNTTTYKTISDSNVNQTYETLYKPANSQTITI